MTRTIVLALLLACGTAQASQWVLAGSTKEGTRSFVDTSSITVTGSNRQARLKMTYPRHTKKDAGKSVDFNLTVATFDCSAGRAKPESMTTYYDDGTSIVAPTGLNNGQQWDHVAPGTVLETVMKFVCGWKPK